MVLCRQVINPILKMRERKKEELSNTEVHRASESTLGPPPDAGADTEASESETFR